METRMTAVTLSAEHAAVIAAVLRGRIYDTGELTMTVRRNDDDEKFAQLLLSLSDAQILNIVARMETQPIKRATEATPIAVHEPAPEPREKANLTAEWVAEGRSLYLAGKPRPDATDGSRKAKHMGFGWDHAKAEAEARLAAPGQEQADIEDALAGGAVDIGDA